MPCDYKEYPKNWKWLSRQVILDAGDRCELCYAPNRTYVQRLKWADYPWYKIKNAQEGEKHTRVVLTVHHIDGDKQNSTKQNLIALCQRCHLRLDLAKHMKNRKTRKNSKQVSLEI